MKTLFFTLLTFFSFTLIAADYEGNWKVEKAISDGMENKDLGSATLEIEPKSLKIVLGDFKITATYQLDKSKDPHQITIETDGEEKTKLYGIIRLLNAKDAKEQKAEIVIDGKKFPTTFEASKLAEGNTYFRLKMK